MNRSAPVIQFHKTGGPEVLKVEEMPVADPREKEVLVRVGALGLSRVESRYRIWLSRSHAGGDTGAAWRLFLARIEPASELPGF
jgi:hypothetical protein